MMATGGSSRSAFESAVGALRRRRPYQLPAVGARELAYMAAAARGEAALAAAAVGRRQLLVGPFLGEVGYELLYWVPFVRRVVRRYRLPRERVVAVTRGGAGCWYSDFAARSIDAYEHFSVERVRDVMSARRSEHGQFKQFAREDFDRELLGYAGLGLGSHSVLHPSAMYVRLRPLYRGWRDPAIVRERGDFRRLAPTERVAGLPERYVAVKAYFNDTLTRTEANAARLQRVVETIARDRDVVVLSAGAAVDDHEEWAAPDAARLHRLDVDPHTNLELQTRVVGHADALVATYGGFSYLGAVTGVPTLALSEVEPAGLPHLSVLRASGLADGFETVRLDAGDSLALFLERLP